MKISFIFLCMMALFGTGTEIFALKRDSADSFLLDLGIDAKKLPACDFEPENTCQGKGSGGHPATIFSTKDGFCAKKIRSQHNVKEIEFYQNFSGVCKGSPERFQGLCDFVPAYGGVCQNSEEVFVKMQNLKRAQGSLLSMKEPRALDMKIGTFTASKMSMERSHESPLGMIFWTVIHVVQDRYLTSSRDRGYRYAGLSVGNPKKYRNPSFFKKLRIMTKPEKILREFTPGPRKFDTLTCFVEKLGRLNSVLAGDFFSSFHLIGASALLVYDFEEEGDRYRNCQVYLIDFANSFMIPENEEESLQLLKNRPFVSGFRKGVFTLMHDFIHSTR